MSETIARYCQTAKSFSNIFHIVWSPRDYTNDDANSIISIVKKYEAAVVTKELGSSGGHPHLDIIVGTNSRTNSVRRSFSTKLGRKMSTIELRIKTVRGELNCLRVFNYNQKEQTKQQLHCHGWKMGIIDRERVLQLKVVRQSELKEKQTKVFRDTAAELIVRYADQKSMALEDKFHFKEVVCEMMIDGYDFMAVMRELRSIYTHVMAKKSSRYQVMEMLDELMGL